jgi:hypothetical protein
VDGGFALDCDSDEATGLFELCELLLALRANAHGIELAGAEAGASFGFGLAPASATNGAAESVAVGPGAGAGAGEDAATEGFGEITVVDAGVDADDKDCFDSGIDNVDAVCVGLVGAVEDAFTEVLVVCACEGGVSARGFADDVDVNSDDGVMSAMVAVETVAVVVDTGTGVFTSFLLAGAS